MLLYLTRAA